MYPNYRNSRSRGNSQSFSHGGNRRFSTQRRGNGFSKRLDPNLFIKEAEKSENNTMYSPQNQFHDFNIVENLRQNIKDHGYLVPTEIQDQAIPYLLEGRDLIGIANTGTGKTAAFLISLINKCYLNRNERVLIVVPTRELAVQIEDEFRHFAKGMGMYAVGAIGGANIRRQTYALMKRPNFVIGTPGRLKDLIRMNFLNLSGFKNIVLDEVDRMVDIGFINDIKYLISLLPKERQSLFFSATVDSKTREILSNFVKNPVTVSVKKQDTAKNIEQDIIRVRGDKSKFDMLTDLLSQPEFSRVMIFGRTKWSMEKLTKLLQAKGFRAGAIHGNKSQNQRQKMLNDFKRNIVNILVATDVAARGLDIEDVSHVINYDQPQTYEDYVHRIGRTGRAGKRGVALTFV